MNELTKYNKKLIIVALNCYIRELTEYLATTDKVELYNTYSNLIKELEALIHFFMEQ